MELLKTGGGSMPCLRSVLVTIWQRGTVVADWLRGVAIPLCSGKGNRWYYSKYQVSHCHSRREGVRSPTSAVYQRPPNEVSDASTAKPLPEDSVSFNASWVILRNHETWGNSDEDYWMNNQPLYCKWKCYKL